MKINRIHSHIAPVIILTLLPSCYAHPEVNIDQNTSQNTFQVSLHKPKSEPEKTQKKMGLAIIKTADLETQEGFVVDSGDFFKSFKIAHSAFLIRHPKGDFLFDTGLGVKAKQDFNQDMPWWIAGFFAFKNHSPLIQQLEKQNYDIKELKGIYLSHLHWDHAGGLYDFPKLNVYTPLKEKEHFIKHADQELGYFKSHTQSHPIQWKTLNFTTQPYHGFKKSIDIYNDGSLILVPLPGHTPGSIGLFVNLPSGERYFLSGDLSWALKGIEENKGKFWLSSYLVDHNTDTLNQSLQVLNQIRRLDPSLHILPTHDHQAQQKWGFYPHFLE